MVEAQVASGQDASADAALIAAPPEPEAEPFIASDSAFESQHHCMHGTLHANGFGHLMRMNARESAGVEERLTGHQLMSIWDSICVLLAAREVSVEDVSNKSGMLLRTLHSSAYGSTW